MFRYRMITVSLIVAVFLGIGSIRACFAWKPTVTEAYNPENLIRLHVLANSDSLIDQSLKLKVRNRVLEEAETLLIQVEDGKLAEKILVANLDRLAEAASEELLRHHQPIPVKAEYGQFFFPERQYPFGTLDAGRYKSLRIILGEGAGRNWWCVLYPPLCLLAPDAPVAAVEAPRNVKVEYHLSLLENWVKAKGLTMDDFWKGWSHFFELI